MRRTLTFTIIMVVLLVAILIGLHFQRTQRTDELSGEVRQGLLGTCSSQACKDNISANFDACIDDYKADYQRSAQAHPAGMILCLDVPVAEYDNFNLAVVNTSTTPRSAPRINPISTIFGSDTSAGDPFTPSNIRRRHNATARQKYVDYDDDIVPVVDLHR